MKWIFEKNSKQYEWFAFRKQFNLKETTGEAMLEISALGRYVLYLNGQYVCRGPVRSYEFEKCCDMVDVGAFLNKGENTVLILSQHLSFGGIYARLTIEQRVLFETDQTFCCKRYDALRADTAVGCPPLEPIAMNEEWYDAKLAQQFEEENELGWTKASFVHEEFSRLMPNKGGLLGEMTVYPEKYMGGAAVLQPSYLGVRIKNPNRIFHKVRKYASEIYFMVIQSSKEQEVHMKKNHTARCTLNGVLVEDVLPLKQGDNLFVFQYFDSLGDCEFIFEKGENISFAQLELNGVTSIAWLQNLEMNDLCFAWAYPDIDPYQGTKSRALIDRVVKVASFEEMKEIAEGFVPATIHPISTGFSISQYQYGTINGIQADPALQLNPSFDASTQFVKDERFMLNQNAGYTTVSPETALFYDFGEERLGYLEFEICAEEGTVLEMDTFEVVDFNGIRHHYKGCMRYECREGWQRYTSFSPKGFRYLCLIVRNSSKPVKIRYISLHQTLAAIKSKGKFECNNHLINEIYQMSVRSAHACMSDTYVDCPGYEQVYWVGDAKVTAHVNLLNFGSYGYDLNCLNMAARNLDDDYKRFFRNDNDVIYEEDKYLVTPAYGSYAYGGLPLWSFSWILQCHDYYLHSGDLDGIRELYPYIRKMLSNCEKMMSSRGLFAMEGAWNLLEWSENDLLPCGEVTGNSALLSLCYQYTERFADALGDKEYANHCRRCADSIKEAINLYCWNEQYGGYVDSVRDEYGYKLYLDYFKKRGMEPVSYQEFLRYNRISEQTNTLVHFCNCTWREREEAVKKIVTRVTKKDYQRYKSSPANNTKNKDRDESKIVALGSPFFFYYVFQSLGHYGYQKEMLEVMEREYSFMMSCGTKNTWETFYNPGAHEWTRSICHGWGSSPAVCLQTEICGVKPLTPGFKTFTFRPNLGGLKRVKSEIMTPYGAIYVEIDEEKGIRKIDYPKECKLVE